MDGALVGAGSLWPPHPSPHGAKLLDSKQKSFFFVLYTWKGAASPYFSVFTLSKIIIVIVSSSSIPVLIQCQLLGLTIPPSMAPCVCRIKSVGFFFFLADEFYYLA
jgi:hypothetical protein